MGGETINKKINTLIIGKIVALLFVISLFIGCTGMTDKEKLLGTWKWTDTEQENTFYFYQNDTFYSYYIHYATNETHKGWGDFELKSNQLYLYTSHGIGGQIDEEYYNYKFSEDYKQLTLASKVKGEILLNKVN